MADYGEDDYVTESSGNPYRRRRIIAMSIALLVTAVTATVIVVATADDEDPERRADSGATASASPSESVASASPTPEESASPTPEPSPTPSASPTPTPSTSPTPSRTPSPRASASARSLYPPKGLVLEVVGEPISGDPPQVRFRIRVRDNDGSEVNGTINFGDGTSLVYSQRPPATCQTTPSSPPPGYRAQPIDKRFTVTHAYERGGRFTVTVTAQTERQCEGTPAETAKQTLIVEVPNRPTPSPTPSPTFISTPSPTASPSASPSPSATRT
ncbi:MAG TPA: hypothetical protein VNA14_03975 [Mycobacteriales bacterium]|nr:hypothetical protein [Mycobacteriales bacterium]